MFCGLKTHVPNAGRYVPQAKGPGDLLIFHFGELTLENALSIVEIDTVLTFIGDM